MTITAETGRPLVPFLRKQLRAAYDVIPARRGKQRGNRSPLRELSLALVNDRKMSELHERFMGIGGPTDVLTFPIDQDRRGRVTSGEVIVCIPQARREARRHRIPVRLEVLLYAIHGMLHLLGYDDRTARDFHTMHAVEDDILTQLGFGPVFAAAPESARPRKPAPPRKRAPHLAPRHGAALIVPGRGKSRRTTSAQRGSSGARR